MFTFLAGREGQERQRKGQWVARLVERYKRKSQSKFKERKGGKDRDHESEEVHSKERNREEQESEEADSKEYKCEDRECEGSPITPLPTKLRDHVDYQTSLSKLCPPCIMLLDQLSSMDLPSQCYSVSSKYQPYDCYHHISFESFYEAVEVDDCHICYLLYRQLPKKYAKISRHEKEFRTVWQAHEEFLEGDSWAPPEASIYLHFYFYGSCGEIEAFPGGIRLAHWEEGNFDVHFRSYYQRETESSSTSSENTQRLCKAWLGRCLSFHKDCDLPSTDNRFPARVIVVGNEGDTTIRLYTPKDLTDVRPYCTLSHRWGNSDIIRLTKDTYEDLSENGVLISALPRTFQDAIQVTRSLGVKYIWIDSLCIFQDSEEDWKSQGLIMDAIYSNGLCNIAANAGKDSHAGLFQARDPNWIRPPVVEISWMSRDTRSPAPRYVMLHNDFWHKEVNDATLYTRGWVAQERLLSTRILHFGSSQVHWECMCLEACESFPRRLPFDSYTSPTLNKKLARAFLARKAGTEKWDPYIGIKDVYSAWQTFVAAYSRCEFTKDEDVLVAVQGIVNSMRQAIGTFEKHDYMSGLWRERFLLSATWYTMAYTGEYAERPMPTRAPTWTWASVKGAVGFHNNSSAVNGMFFFTVRASDIDLEAGRITLHDIHLQNCQWVATSATAPELGVMVTIRFWFNDQLLSAEARLDESQLIQQCLKTNTMANRLRIYALVTSLAPDHLTWGLEGLLLTQRGGLNTNEFERIGSFRIHRLTFKDLSIWELWDNQQSRFQAFGPARTIELF